VGRLQKLSAMVDCGENSCRERRYQRDDEPARVSIHKSLLFVVIFVAAGITASVVYAEHRHWTQDEISATQIGC
jgi:hypothetical protein